MNHFRYSLGALLVATALAALAIASARHWGWTATVFTVSVAVLASATLYTFCGKPNSRMFCLGFAVFDWSYFVAFTLRGGDLLTTGLLLSCFSYLKGSTTWVQFFPAHWEPEFITVGHCIVMMCVASIGGAITRRRVVAHPD